MRGSGGRTLQMSEVRTTAESARRLGRPREEGARQLDKILAARALGTGKQVPPQVAEMLTTVRPSTGAHQLQLTAIQDPPSERRNEHRGRKGANT